MLELGINEIEPNSNQPRKSFDEKALIQLSESIKEHGIIQPIIVKKKGIYTGLLREKEDGEQQDYWV